MPKTVPSPSAPASASAASNGKNAVVIYEHGCACGMRPPACSNNMCARIARAVPRMRTATITSMYHLYIIYSCI
jgi:hypothetical protein